MQAMRFLGVAAVGLIFFCPNSLQGEELKQSIQRLLQMGKAEPVRSTLHRRPATLRVFPTKCI
jgi:hypothetical protein